MQDQMDLAMEGTLLASSRRSGRKFTCLIISTRQKLTQCRGRTIGWTGLIRVDGTAYTWMGNPSPLPEVVNQTSFEYTATRSIFSLVAGPVNLNVTFLSPVFPTDLKRQSLPFSYVDVSISSSDGESHDVQLYTDITSGKSTLPSRILYDTDKRQ